MAQIRKVENKKGISYKVVIRLKGFKAVYKTFDDFKQAKKWARAVEEQMERGNYYENSDNIKPIVTVKDLIDDFEKNIAPKKYSKPQQYTCMYDWWRDKIGNLNVSDLNTNILTRCRNTLISEPPDKPYKEHKTKSNSTVRKYLFALSAVLRYAERELEIIDRNPMSRVDKPRKSKGVVRFLSDSERSALITACKDYSDTLYLFVMLAMFSGGRYNELLTLKIENIDFHNDILHFLETKNGESRGVPIYHKITELITEYMNKSGITTGYLFINPKSGKLHYLKGMFENVIDKISLKDFRFHDLRHTYASYLAQNGAELLEISQLMGHRNLQQVQIYAHLTRKHTSKVVRKMTANMLDFK
nr:MAG TPA: Integrase [Caudoviricetes sp.]